MKVTYNGKQIQQYLNRVNRRLVPFTEDLFGQIGRLLLKGVQLNLSGQVLKKRSGRLYNAWGYQIVTKGSTIQLIVGAFKNNVPYDEIHDKGGRTGRNHATLIPARRYYSRVPEERGAAINKMIANKLKRIMA